MERILVVLLCAFLCSSCTKVKKEEPRGDLLEEAAGYVELLKNYKVREKKPGNTVDNEEFDRFMDEVFVEMLDDDYLGMHFTIVDYKKMNIEKNLTIGKVEYAFDEENFNYFKELNERLQKFDYDSLSYRQQIDYDVIEYNSYEMFPSYFYYQFEFLLSEADNAVENIISYFTDFTFYDKESVDDYMVVLADIDRYFDDILKYTAAQAEDGYPMPDEWIDYTQNEVCASITNRREDNDLIVTFDKHIDELDFLSDAEKADYKQKNKQIVLEEVLPAYDKVAEEIEKYRGKASSDDYRLYKLDKDYAEYTYMVAASNNVGIEELLQLIKDCLSDLEAAYLSCYYDPASWQHALELEENGNELFSLPHAEILEYLRTHINEYFPDLGDISYTVDLMDPDNAPNSTVAYYWPSPVDNIDQNIIRVNPNSSGVNSDYYSYMTLAHEGFPGHLYQNAYYNRNDPPYLRNMFSFIGYSEGWAVYGERYALSVAGIDDELAEDVLYFDGTSYFPQYSLYDLMYDGLGMSAKDVYGYLKEESIFNYNQEYCDFFYDFIADNQAVYCSYGLGAAKMFELQSKVKRALGDKFDYSAFHDVVNKNGPLPFPILETIVDAYISENQ